MDIAILLILTATTLFLLFFSRRRTSAEIAEALGARDHLIESLRCEIKDRFDDVISCARATRAHSVNAAKAVVEMKVAAKDVLATEHLDLLEDAFTVLATLNNKMTRAEKQIGENKRLIAELKQDTARPPIGPLPTPFRLSIDPPELSPDAQPESHCHDGPNDLS